MKKTIKNISFTLLAFSLFTTYLQAETDKDLKINHELTSILEINSENTVSIYNTGLNLNMEEIYGFSADFRGSIDGKIDEIRSEDFELGEFVKELRVNYQVETENAVLLLSVGKMSTGTKIDRDNPKSSGGTMGFRLSVKPDQIPLIQNWLNKHEFKITRIDIIRYKAGTENDLNLDYINETDMTSYGVYLSKGKKLQTFFVYKTPDNDNLQGVTSRTIGGIYMMDGKLKPQFFAMKHQSDSSFIDLDLTVVSAGIEILPGIRGKLSYSYAEEAVRDTKKETYNLSFSKAFNNKNKNNKIKFNGTIGVKVERGSSEDEVYYFRLEARY